MTIEKLDLFVNEKIKLFEKINEITDAVNILKLNIESVFKWINKQNHCGDDCECSEENKFNSQDSRLETPNKKQNPDIYDKDSGHTGFCSEYCYHYKKIRNQTLDEVENIIKDFAKDCDIDGRKISFSFYD